MTFKVKILPVFLCIVLFLFGCQKKQEAYVSASTTIRDNTPVCLVPSADGRIVFSNEYVTVDASNASEGYIMAAYLGSNSNVKLQLTGPDYMTYTYDITVKAYRTGEIPYKIYIKTPSGWQYATTLTYTAE